MDSVPKLVEEYLNKEMDLDSFVTQQSPIDDINKCFKDMETGNKSVVEPFIGHSRLFFSLRIVLTMWPVEKEQ